MELSNQTSEFVVPFLISGGEMGKRIREFEWSATSLGPVQLWSASLQSALSICLNSNFPIAIYWGPELILLYNDAWSSIPGGKHPWALGQPAAKVWPDIWEQIQPQFKKAFSGEPGGSKDALLPMQRHGYTEECYFDFTFTPVIGAGGKVEGVFNAVIETTYRIINERRTSFLQRMASALAQVLIGNDLFSVAIGEIKTNPQDIPFCFIYSLEKGAKPVLEESTLQIDRDTFFRKPWPLEALVKTGHSIYIKDLEPYLTDVPAGFWPEPPSEALMTSLKAADGTINGFMILGISSRRGFDKEYQGFMEGVAVTLSSAGNTIRAFEEERKRAEALAEIDRAKTTFFSNISHEFRTPLTLLLGPLEEALNDPNTIHENKFRTEVAYRNALRMQKLVNSLLEFSRIEAGRVEGRFTRVDIGRFTADLASTFRSAIEKAGMELRVDLKPVSDEVYIDTDMWEKIILNLVSNAFKYSKQGAITISVHQVENKIKVAVSDTGIGISQDQLDQIFNRFHRVENTEGRSQEGTGIGLAMVKELVRLHHGTIQVQSTPGKGSTFTVTLPVGKDHLPEEKIIQPAQPIVSTGSAAYVEEALKWLPDQDDFAQEKDISLPSQGSQDKTRHKILLADDNADMRAYVSRLLSEHFEVVTAVDGNDAFEKMQHVKPDLLISDIMMPQLDGFGLLQKVRNQPELKQVPVIFLSARAGEEAKVEGLNAGADDYLVKPFSAKELLVRATNLIRINQVRHETEEQFYQLFLQAPALINVFKGAEMRYEFFHPKNKEIFGDVDFTGKTIREVLPELESQGIFEMLAEVYETGKMIHQSEMLVHFTGEGGKGVDRYLNFTYQPWFDLKGKIQGVLNFAIDVTEMVEARKKVEASERQFRCLVEEATVATALLEGEDMVLTVANEVMLQNWGRDKSVIGSPLLEFMPEIRDQAFPELLKKVYKTGITYTAQDALVKLTIDGELKDRYMDFSYKALPHFKEDKGAVLVMATDVTEKVLAKRQLEESERNLRHVIEQSPVAMCLFRGPKFVVELSNERMFDIWGRSKEEIIGKPIFEGLPEAKDQGFEEALERVYTTGETFSAYEVPVSLPRNGQLQTVFLNYVYEPIRNGEGYIYGIVAVGIEVTDLVQARQKIEDVVAQRTRELAEANKALQHSNGELARSNKNLEEFAYAASHDMKEPIRKIHVFSDRLKESFAGNLSATQQHYFDRLKSGAQRMSTLIDDLLSFSQVNVLPIEMQPVDLNDIITQVLQDMEIGIEEKGAIVQIDKLPVINGYPRQLQQAFQNLLGNALKFHKPDEPPRITISSCTVEGSDLPVTLGDNSGQNSYYLIEVADNGIGFKEEEKEKIFNLFTRLHGNAEYKGTGIGLSIVRKIAENHNGFVIAKGESSKGATFQMYLPVYRKA